MKPNSITKPNFQSIPVYNGWDSLKTSNVDNPFNFHNFTEPLQMNYKELEPPPYMWDRIAKVLDEQDRSKAIADTHNAFVPIGFKKKTVRKAAVFIAAIMIAGAIVAVS